MNRVISWLQSIKVRQILTVFLVVLTFFVGTAFDKYGNELQAQAETVTPEATEYHVGPAGAQDVVRDAKQATKNAQESTKETGNNLFDTIREKLNLDEPIDPGTKQAAEQLKETASEVVKAPQRALKGATD